jgi:hypothetical protein
VSWEIVTYICFYQSQVHNPKNNHTHIAAQKNLNGVFKELEDDEIGKANVCPKF